MISFLLCLAILIVGYFVYGKIVDNTFGPDDRETPAVRINDGVDYVVMPHVVAKSRRLAAFTSPPASSALAEKRK